MEEHNILVFLRPRRLESGVRVRGRNVSPRNYRVSGTWSYDFSAINPVYDNGAGVIKRTTHSSASAFAALSSVLVVVVGGSMMVVVSCISHLLPSFFKSPLAEEILRWLVG